MNVVLLLEDQEVELKDNISIPITKSFGDLDNPTNIIVDYTKNIKIPITSQNNRVLSNSYRLDRNINQSSNIGLYLDPTKKIKAKLLYNSSVVIDGYVKFTSSDNDGYNLVLFGKLGEIIQDLKSIVLDASQLTPSHLSKPNPTDYILVDRCNANPLTINSSYVARSWNNEQSVVYGEPSPYDIIGFAPSYRGYYGDFESDKIQTGSSTIITIEEYLNDKWAKKYQQRNGGTYDNALQYAEKLKSNEVIGDGFKDFEMNEYRACMLKPYIYFNQLLQMYKDQLEIISDYKMELDVNWFNMNNPYWTNMCYMLDYLDSNNKEERRIQISPLHSDLNWSYSASAVDQGWISGWVTSNTIISSLSGKTDFTINPFDLNFTLGYNSPNGYGTLDVIYDERTYFKITLTANNRSSTIEKNYYASYSDFETIEQYINLDEPLELDGSNFIKLIRPTDIEVGVKNGVNILYHTNRISIPTTIFENYPITNQIAIRTDVKIINEHTEMLFKNVDSSQLISAPAYLVSQYVSCPIPAFTSNIDWRKDLQVNLSNIYYKEEPLFDVILQYTKMFGLLWDIDYNEKVIKIQHRSTYFKNYEIEDWNDRVYKNKQYTIEPINSNSKNISFNYESVNGKNYTSYRDKYGEEYGSKMISMDYDFGEDVKKLFNNIHPSSVSSKKYVPFAALANWDLNSNIPSTQTPYPVIDCENEDESNPITLYNWYLRLPNITSPSIIRITDASSYQTSKSEYCWFDPFNTTFYNYTPVTKIPQFSIAYKSNERPNLLGKTIGCVFNTPYEDYTSNKSVSDMLGNTIYDICWKDFINENYNTQNKKLTSYIDYKSIIDFKFNKFVVIDNQLFRVNKILDFDIVSQTPPKVELVQVTDPSVYTTINPLFPKDIISPQSIYIKGSQQDDVYGEVDVKCYTTHLVDDSLTSGVWNLSGTFIGSNGREISDFSEYVYISTLGFNTKSGIDSIQILWDNMEDCVFNGTLTYTTPSNTIISIPVVIDYTI